MLCKYLQRTDKINARILHATCSPGYSILSENACVHINHAYSSIVIYLYHFNTHIYIHTCIHMHTQTHALQTGQNQITGIVVGVVVSILFVIGMVSIVVYAILFQQRCGRKWNKKPQIGLGIRKLYI